LPQKNFQGLDKKKKAPSQYLPKKRELEKKFKFAPRMERIKGKGASAAKKEREATGDQKGSFYAAESKIQ